MEASGHGLGGQRPREEAEAVRHRALLAEVRRVGEAHDHAGEKTRAGVVGGHDPAQHVPERRVGGGDRRGLREERLELDLVGEAAQRLVEMAPDLVVGVAGDGPDVDLHLDGVRDHVRLHAAVADVRRERRVGRGPRELRHVGRELPDGRLDAVRIDERRLQLRVYRQRLDEGPPEVVDVGSRAVVRETAHDLRGLHQRVVGAVRHRAVAGRALHAQLPPRHALLADVHGDGQLAVERADGAAVLGQ